MDGVSIASDTATTAWNEGSANIIRFGDAYANGLNGDVVIDQVYITNNPNTPQIPTANGVPLDMPIVRND